MTEYMRVPREPTEAMLANGREALLPLVRLDSYGPLIGLWRDMLAASPQGEGSSADPAPIKPSADTGELRERVAASIGSAWAHGTHGKPFDVKAETDAILDLIRSEREGSPIGQNDQPGLAFSDAGET